MADDLHAPDVLLVQEAEDQDICTVSGTTLACGTDGRPSTARPDTLQELALRIAAVGGPRYDAAYDRDGADDRGIVAAFLYRADRVALLPANRPVLGATPTVAYRGAALAYNTDVQNPKALNADLPSDVDSRPASTLERLHPRARRLGTSASGGTASTRAASASGHGWTSTAISNHFSSTPNARVGQRREQAAYVASDRDGAPGREPGRARRRGRRPQRVPPARTTRWSGERPARASLRIGLEPLRRLVAEVRRPAYTYVFEGQAQVLDHQFVTARLGDG